MITTVEQNLSFKEATEKVFDYSSSYDYYLQYDDQPFYVYRLDFDIDNGYEYFICYELDDTFTFLTETSFKFRTDFVIGSRWSIVRVDVPRVVNLKQAVCKENPSYTTYRCVNPEFKNYSIIHGDSEVYLCVENDNDNIELRFPEKLINHTWVKTGK